jgi:hypothetical protein
MILERITAHLSERIPTFFNEAGMKGKDAGNICRLAAMEQLYTRGYSL